MAQDAVLQEIKKGAQKNVPKKKPVLVMEREARLRKERAKEHIKQIEKSIKD